ncbi:hybrid sensor histidine kinase/response regulator [Aquimarina sp. BL5]|uniref:hybrid sensor histidine kinase/response regulator n=1 Tax=Aquimarina sp. BL5 TaxID=1714860 RepID=UPI000E4D6908|nr:hybrid sensor histidine kinase/response regulator [Aquimarina sp. BL5]AXT52622.1 hybrid sensor histidine kinase/response regulator [Aquimarina sp. BL5]RKN11686.1 response regulator [Aquimarina sp. BL5]
MEYSILVVDDQPDNIKYISLLLKEMELGKKIYSAPNGKIALGLAEKITPDIILSDWEMPEMNGLELLKALKQSAKTKDIPFIMISAVKVDAVSMKESFDAGVHDYLKKPFDKLEFMARVSATLKLQGAYLKIKKNNDEIANQALLISKQHEELKKLNKLKDNIFSIISHDVRSPLATLDGLLQLFDDDQHILSEEELREYTGVVRLELNKVQTLLDNLLYWAKSQLANMQDTKSNVDVYEITQEVLSLFEERTKKKKLNLHNNIDPDYVIYADKNMLSFVIRNLLANAVKYTLDEGIITINAEFLMDSVKVSIKDNGIGMRSETLENLFKDRTVDTQTGTSGEMGTGLGLVLCKDLIEQSGGSISVKSVSGEGSEFIFIIPYNT